MYIFSGFLGNTLELSYSVYVIMYHEFEFVLCWWNFWKLRIAPMSPGRTKHVCNLRWRSILSTLEKSLKSSSMRTGTHGIGHNLPVQISNLGKVQISNLGKVQISNLGKSYDQITSGGVSTGFQKRVSVEFQGWSFFFLEVFPTKTCIHQWLVRRNEVPIKGTVFNPLITILMWWSPRAFREGCP